MRFGWVFLLVFPLVACSDFPGASDSSSSSSSSNSSASSSSGAFPGVLVPTGVTTTLNAIWAASDTDIWAVGEGGTVIHGDGETFAPVASGVTDALKAIWGFGPSDIWAVGGNSYPDYTSVVIHWDGTAWTELPTPPAVTFTAVHGLQTRSVWALTVFADLFHWDGNSWSLVTNLDDTAYSVWAVSDQEVYIGNFHGQLFRWNGVTAEAIAGSPVAEPDLLGPNNISSLYWDGADLWVPSGDHVYRYGAAGWRDMAFPGGSTRVVTGDGPDDVWLLDYGNFHHWDGASWSTLESGRLTPGPIGMFLAPSNVWLAGIDGSMRRISRQ